MSEASPTGMRDGCVATVARRGIALANTRTPGGPSSRQDRRRTRCSAYVRHSMVDGPVAAPRRPLDTTTIANQRGLMIQPSTSRSQPWSSSRQILQLGGDRRGGQPVAGPVQQAGQLLDAEAAVGEQEGEQQVRVGGAGGRRRVGFVLDDDQLVEGQAEHARQAGEQRQGDGPLVEVDLQVIQVNADGCGSCRESLTWAVADRVSDARSSW